MGEPSPWLFLQGLVKWEKAKTPSSWTSPGRDLTAYFTNCCFPTLWLENWEMDVEPNWKILLLLSEVLASVIVEVFISRRRLFPPGKPTITTWTWKLSMPPNHPTGWTARESPFASLLPAVFWLGPTREQWLDTGKWAGKRRNVCCF